MKSKGINTICVHSGILKDENFGSSTSPIYTSTSYNYLDRNQKIYPRSFNSPNQNALAKCMAELEKGEKALIYSSGMSAIAAVFMTLLKSGDHIVIQKDIYGGAYNFITKEFDKFGIEYSFADDTTIASFEKLIKKNTKAIYIETPSNPLLKIIDVKAIADLASSYKLTSIIDNTFASPINQNPIELGIDIVIHSATKYLSGHSDISAGTVICNEEFYNKLVPTSYRFGGNLSEMTVYLLERSIKTLALRVNRQCDNALELSNYLQDKKYIKSIYYPGLKNHFGHDIAKKQMKKFGGIISFELIDSINPIEFQKKLKLVKSSLSLAGVESTILSPYLTSHYLMPKEARIAQGITDNLLRFSVGIEETDDLIYDLEQAL